MKPCIACEIVPFNRQGQQVERGDPAGVHWGYATPPKHRGACLAGCGCAVQQNTHADGSGSAQVQRKRRGRVNGRR